METTLTRARCTIIAAIVATATEITITTIVVVVVVVVTIVAIIVAIIDVAVGVLKRGQGWRFKTAIPRRRSRNGDREPALATNATESARVGSLSPHRCRYCATTVQYVMSATVQNIVSSTCQYGIGRWTGAVRGPRREKLGLQVAILRLQTDELRKVAL
jgi:hypothetical protein